MGRRLTYTYFMRAENGLIKIGQTNSVTYLHERLARFHSVSPIPVELIGVTRKYSEEELHAHFAHVRVRGEWFAPCADLLSLIHYCARSIEPPPPLKPRTKLRRNMAAFRK